MSKADDMLKFWAGRAKAIARTLPEYDGDIEHNQWIIEACSHVMLIEGVAVVVILTRDNLVKMGFWKNIDFARCLHLSISFRDPCTNQTVPWCNATAKRIVAAVFGIDARLTWWEPAYTPEGKFRGVQHWRLFYSPNWSMPIHPKGEPHTLNVPFGWNEWTEYQADTPTPNFNADITKELPKRRPSDILRRSGQL